MSERLSSTRPVTGNDAAKLRKWAYIFLAVGVVGKSMLQNAMLGMNTLSGEEFLAALDGTGSIVILTVALMCRITATCAVPLLAFLLVEGFQRTSSFEKYLLRVGALALICELPYNFAMNGQLLHTGTRNPVFALVLCLVMLHFFTRFSEKSLKNILMKVLIFAAAFGWCWMLKIDDGIFMVIYVAALWFTRKKGNLRAMYAFSGAMVSSLFSMYYMGSGLSCIMLHRYNEERGEQNRLFNYAFYPVTLLVVGIAAKFM